jgi:hypothetical protein
VIQQSVRNIDFFDFKSSGFTMRFDSLFRTWIKVSFLIIGFSFDFFFSIRFPVDKGIDEILNLENYLTNHKVFKLFWQRESIFFMVFFLIFF